MRHRIGALINTIFIASLLFLQSCFSISQLSTYYPGATWEIGESSLSAQALRDVNVFVQSIETTGLLVVQHGKVVFEYGDVAEVSYVASVRKSILSMLYGRHVADGTIRLDATLKDLGMSEIGGLLPIEQRAKVVDLISARSGVYHPASNAGDLLDYAPERGSREPGSYWLYSNWDFNAAGAAFERITGRNIYDALRDDLAIPIEMQDFDRNRQVKDELPERSLHPAYTMWLSTRDMARLGYLMLRNGRWRDEQLVPAEWVKRSTSVVTPRSELHPDFMLSEPFGYGYMWWVWDGDLAGGPYEGAFTASGAHGQYITILPALDMVVAHKTFWSSAGGPKHNVRRADYYRLLDLLTGANPASTAELHAWTQKLR